MSRPGAGKRARREDVRPLWGFGRGVIVLALIAAVIVIALRAGGGLPLQDDYTVKVDLKDAGALRMGSGVDIAGVRVGKVLTKERTDGGRARVTLRLKPQTRPLAADTTARVRAQGLLGARFLELTPGRSKRPLADGGFLRDGGITNGVPEALTTFRKQTREALGGTVRAAGAGLADRGEQLNDALGVAPDLAADITAVSDAVLARGDAAARLLPSVRSGISALESGSEDMARAFTPGAESLEPFIDRRAPTRAGLAAAPGALTAADAGLGRGRAVLAGARKLSAAAATVLPSAPGGLRAATRLLRDGRRPLRTALPLVRDLRPTVPSLLAVTDALDPVLDPLRTGVSDLRPTLLELGKRRCDLDNFGENWRSMLGYGVAGGGKIGPLNSIRFEAIASNESLAGMGPLPQKLLLGDGLVSRDTYPDYCRYSPGGPYSLDRLGGGKR